MNLIVGHDQTGRRRTTTSAIPRVCAAAVGFVPIAASAHVAVGGSEGFVHGFSHPLGGIDHVLAMVAVGLFAARLRGRAVAPVLDVCLHDGTGGHCRNAWRQVAVR